MGRSFISSVFPNQQGKHCFQLGGFSSSSSSSCCCYYCVCGIAGVKPKVLDMLGTCWTWGADVRGERCKAVLSSFQLVGFVIFDSRAGAEAAKNELNVSRRSCPFSDEVMGPVLSTADLPLLHTQ